MDFDPAVADLCAEPFALHPDSYSPEGFVPNLLVLSRRGQLRVVDVASEHQQRLASSQARIGQMQRACAQLGWEYTLMGEPDRTFMANLVVVQARARVGVQPALPEQLVDHRSQQRVRAVRRARSSCPMAMRSCAAASSAGA